MKFSDYHNSRYAYSIELYHRVVTRIEEDNSYYPYGMSVADNYFWNQPYKFGGKELDRMNGLDLYDFGARMLDSVAPTWSTHDPLAEKYCSINPYSYCMGNPIFYIDPNGEDVKEAWNKFTGAFSSKVSIGLQATGQINLSGKKVGGSLNLISAEIGSLKNGELSFNENATFTQGLELGIGIISLGEEKTVVEISDNKSIATDTKSVSVGLLTIQNNTEKTVTTNNSSSSTVQNPNTSNSSTNVTIGVNAALILGANIEIDLSKILESVKELFK